MDKKEAFEDWFYEQEGFGIRAERAPCTADNPEIFEWIKTAFEVGFEAGSTAKKTCPWSNPEFDIPIDQPCPVCGMTGNIDAEDRCVG